MNSFLNFLKPLRTLSMAFLAVVSSTALTAPVALQNATATFSQTYTGDYSPSKAIDGNPGGDYGWAIYDGDGFGGVTSAQTAVFETVNDVGGPGGSLIEFKLEFNLDWNPGHQLGRFRLSATTDDRDTFADGLSIGGDVTANWTVLDVLSFASSGGAITLIEPDGSLLAHSTLLPTDLYTVVTKTDLVGITGFRLEALEDPSLPTSGPGLQPDNGNFVLSEFTVDITSVPVPEAVVSPWLLLLGGWLAARRVRR